MSTRVHLLTLLNTHSFTPSPIPLFPHQDSWHTRSSSRHHRQARLRPPTWRARGHSASTSPRPFLIQLEATARLHLILAGGRSLGCFTHSISALLGMRRVLALTVPDIAPTSMSAHEILREALHRYATEMRAVWTLRAASRVHATVATRAMVFRVLTSMNVLRQMGA